MNNSSPGLNILEWTGRAAYLFAFLLIAVPLLSAGARLWPPDPATVSWRLDFEALLSGYLLTIASGFILANALAVGQRRQTLLRTLGTLSILFGVFLLGLLIDMTMNALQLRNEVTESNMAAFYATTAVSLIEFFATGVLVLWLGMIGFRAARRFQEEAPRADTEEGPAQPLSSIWTS